MLAASSVSSCRICRTAHVWYTAADDLCDMAIYGQGRIERNTKQLDILTEWQHRINILYYSCSVCSNRNKNSLKYANFLSKIKYVSYVWHSYVQYTVLCI